MNRRAFISALGGAAAGSCWPLAALAQQAAMPVVGFLHARSPEDMVPQIAGFRRGLAESGYVESQSVKVEYRWGRGQSDDQLPAMAAQLVSLGVNVLVGGSDAAAVAAKATTRSSRSSFPLAVIQSSLGWW